jgi:hypothetical protein
MRVVNPVFRKSVEKAFTFKLWNKSMVPSSLWRGLSLALHNIFWFHWLTKLNQETVQQPLSKMCTYSLVSGSASISIQSLPRSVDLAGLLLVSISERHGVHTTTANENRRSEEEHWRKVDSKGFWALKTSLQTPYLTPKMVLGKRLNIDAA